ncbi:MAG: Coenzyme F420-dependent N10-methylene tetrahydromethanopterin reductase-like protein [Microbacteriaceae bacterium]|jgi:alkanesulfonate monooxygenase SsuD/methylene tetrahydromethanopterin reductase-like flavin-dependent oxidoreductase (luciferase family)|nr:Coenzyme F420-dependent N10-methylene tetrahydromethanopterin reductase-like protein [Microbacteriaceae bacterium]
MALRIGIGLPFTDGAGDPHDAASLGERARWIEEAGFSGIWMGDASFRGLATWPDPWLWMAAAAAVTSRVELGFAALQLPLRHPVDNAQRLMTLQTLSDGRLSAGVAPGSTAAGFEAMGESFEGRFAKFQADMTTIRALNHGEEVNGADLSPWPVVPQPRFLLAAWAGGKMLERAVTEYDGWLCSAGRTTVKTIVEGLKRYRDLGGERALVASCSADLTARDVPMGDDDPFSLRCSPEEAADRLAWIADQGFDDILINIRDGRSPGPFDSDLEHDKLLELRSLYEPAAAYTKAAR